MIRRFGRVLTGLFAGVTLLLAGPVLIALTAALLPKQER